MSTAATMHWKLPFYIVQCSLELFGSVVLEHSLVLDFDDDAIQGKSLCNSKLKLLDRVV